MNHTMEAINELNLHGVAFCKWSIVLDMGMIRFLLTCFGKILRWFYTLFKLITTDMIMDKFGNIQSALFKTIEL